MGYAERRNPNSRYNRVRYTRFLLSRRFMTARTSEARQSFSDFSAYPMLIFALVFLTIFIFLLKG